MNSLIILPSECVGPDTAKLTGARAVYAWETHGLREGQRVQAACLGGNRGEATVLEATKLEISLALSLSEPPLKPFPADLIVGISRPQTIRKVIQSATMLGVRSLHFVRSERAEKSYLQSTALYPDEIEQEGIKALEQVWDSRMPEISVHRTFTYFMEHRLSEIVATDSPSESISLLIAHPGGAPIVESVPPAVGRFVLAVGSERGWSDGEVQEFRERGFIPVGLGERITRVEIALTFALGQIAASQGMSQ